VVAPTSSIDLTIAEGGQIPIEERDDRELGGITFAGTFRAGEGDDASAFETLTSAGTYAFDFEGRHELAVTAKGDGVYQVDGWARTSPPGVEIFNPAFDVTPADLVTAIVTETGVVKPPFGESLLEACEGSGSIHEIAVDG
jgi:methylthioribose-1-phosphate isomerase